MNFNTSLSPIAGPELTVINGAKENRHLITPEIEAEYRTLLQQTCFASVFDDNYFVIENGFKSISAHFSKLGLPEEDTKLLKCFYIDSLAIVQPKTCNRYLADLKYLFEFLTEINLHIEALSTALLHRFAHWLDEKEPNANKKNQISTSVNCLIGFMDTLGILRSGLVIMDDYWEIKAKTPTRAPESNVIEILDKYYFNFDNCIPTDFRCCYMVARLILSRINEVLDMNLNCLSPDVDDIYILSMDTKKGQSLGIKKPDDYPFCKDGYVEQCLFRAIVEQQKYSESVQDKVPAKIKGQLFVSAKSPYHLLTDQSFNNHLGQVCRELQIIDSKGKPVSITSHALRHYGTVARFRDGRFSPQLIAAEANHNNVATTFGYGYSAKSEETKRTSKIQTVALPKRFVSSQIQPIFVTERKYNQLLNQDGNRLIPDKSLCNGTSCHPQFELCFYCECFKPDVEFIPSFELACGILEARIAEMQQTQRNDYLQYSLKQLDIFRQFLDRANELNNCMRE